MKTNRVFAANILLTDEMSPPDSIHLSNNPLPPPSFVISRSLTGETISKYSDDEWNFSSYDKKNRPCILSFKYWANGEVTDVIYNIISDLKKLVFSYIWLREGKKYQVKNISKLGSTLNILARYCMQNTIAIGELLISKQHLNNCLITLKAGTMYDVRRFLLAFNDVKTEHKPFEFCDIKKLTEMNAIIINYRNNLKQFPPIPPRIYLEYIGNITSNINIILENIDLFLDFTLEIKHKIKVISRLSYNARYINTPPEYNIGNIITNHQLDFIFNHFSANKNLAGIIYLLNSMLFICRLTIQMFTGMRIDEATNLHMDCAEIYRKNNQIHYIINGRTTKLMERKAKWITNKAGYDATCIASKISHFIINQIEGFSYEVSDIPLFVRTSYLGLVKKGPNIETSKILPAELTPYDEMKKISWLNIMITKEDIFELKRIDPFRDWDSESKFNIGQYWPLQTHQLRRSLALYASKSGLVTLSSLRRQLQHLSAQMTLYYSRGSAFAQNLIANDKLHFAAEYQETQNYTQALDYINLILLSDNNLFGAHGTLIKRNSKNNISLDKKETLKLFKTGQMAYTETCLGGCTTLDVCKQRATRSLVSCLTCEHAIIKKDKLELVIKAQQKFLRDIDKNTLTYRTEKQDLQLLEKYLNIYNSKLGEENDPY
ncbi:hypothetical protein ML110_003823 [Klebsiella pneumoniae]|nr:hypothetical protein [Klebsiella pneumoniae]